MFSALANTLNEQFKKSQVTKGPGGTDPPFPPVVTAGGVSVRVSTSGQVGTQEN